MQYLFPRSRCWLGSLFFLLLSQVAFADEVNLLDLDLEQLMEIEIVSSASRYEQKLETAPSSVTIVSRDDIQKFGYRKLSELIQGVRGFYATNDRSYSYTGVRGFGRPADYDTRVLVLLNGHRLNDSIYSSSLLGLDFLLDIDLVEKVEIVRGPSSSIHGTNAFFGVINVVTRDPVDVGAEVSADVAQFDTYQGRMSYGKKFENGIELLLSATRFDSEGDGHIYFEEFDDPETNNGVAENLDGENGYSSFLHLAYENITFETGIVDRYKYGPTAAYETVFNDSSYRTQDTRYFADLQYSNELSHGITLESRLYYDWYEYNGKYLNDYAEEGDPEPFFVKNDDFNRGERIGAQVDLLLERFEGNKILFGAEVREDYNIDQRNVDVDPFYSYIDRTDDETVFALFAQDDISLNDWITLHLGMRFDEYDSVGSEYSPRAGLLFFPSDRSTFKLLFGRAFRAPNAFELYYSDGDIQKQPEFLDAEEIYTYEVVYERRMNQSTRVVLDGYFYEINGLIDQRIDSEDGLLVYQNTEKIRAYGLEAEIESRFARGWLANPDISPNFVASG
jgi:outer membrane receptor for ferrienterochelin and colicins